MSQAQSGAGAPQRTLPQSKDNQLKSYSRRLKDDVKSMMDSYTEIVKLARVSGIYH